MMGGSDDFSRRRILGLCSLTITGTIAGCSSNSGSPEQTTSQASSSTPPPSGTPTGAIGESPTPSDTLENTPAETPTETPPQKTDTDQTETEHTETEQTETPDPIQNLQLQTINQPELPGVWTENDSLNDFETVLGLNAQTRNGQPLGKILVKDEDADTLEKWMEEKTVVQQKVTQTAEEMREGENTYTAKATEYNQEDTTQAQIQTPQSFLLNLKPGNQENKENPIFTTYSSHNQITHDKKTIDLKELENWHDNEYENLKKDRPEMGRFVQGVTDEDKLSTVKQFKEEHDDLRVFYPNKETSGYEGGYFNHIEYVEADSAGEALDWLHPLLFNFEHKYDRIPISTEDEKFAAVIQECFDRYNENFDAHVWSFNIPRKSRNTHGNGLIWDETNDELRVNEIISAPATSEFGEGPQYHSLIEDSNYLNPEHDAFKEWWHPLRFDGTEPEKDTLTFRDGKEYAEDIFRGIGTSARDEDINNSLTRVEAGRGVTTGYITDIIENLRNYNVNEEFDFETIKEQSKVYNKLSSIEGNYIAGGTLENPIYAEVEDKSVLDEVWEDQDGTLVEYVDDLDQDGFDQLVAS